MLRPVELQRPTDPSDIAYVAEVGIYDSTLKEARKTNMHNPWIFQGCRPYDGGYGVLYEYSQELVRNWVYAFSQDTIVLRDEQFRMLEDIGEVTILQHSVTLTEDIEVKVLYGSYFQGKAKVDSITLKSLAAITPEEIRKSGMSDYSLNRLLGKTRELHGKHSPYTLINLKRDSAENIDRTRKTEMLAGRVIDLAFDQLQS